MGAYDTAFILLVVLVCLIGVALALAFVHRAHPSGLKIFLPSLLAGAAAGIFAWGTVALVVDKKINEPPYYSSFGIVYGAIFLFCFFLVIAFPCDDDGFRYFGGDDDGFRYFGGCYQLTCGKKMAVFVFATLVLLVPGLVVLCVNYRTMAQVGRYEYFGPMRLTDYGSRSSKSRGDAKDYWRYYGEVHVSWGMSWGCPELPHWWCSATLNDLDCKFCRLDNPGHDCHRFASSNEEGIRAAEECVMEKYDLYEWSDKFDFDDPVYDREVAPDQDADWPFVPEIFGDCSTCHAAWSWQLETLTETAVRMKWAGVGLAVAGAAVYAALLVQAAWMKKAALLESIGLCHHEISNEQ